MPVNTAVQYRIPVVDSLHYPGQPYILCVVVGDDVWNRGLMPDEAELRLLRSFLDFRLSGYYDHVVARMAREPFDIDPAVNTMVLMKRAPGDWCYRMTHWQQAGVFPDFRELTKIDLPDLLKHRDFRGWPEWLTEHPAG